MTTTDPTPSLAEYRRLDADDDNTFWRLSPGDHQNLLEEAIEEIDRLRAELAETRRVADHNQASLLKGMDAAADQCREAAARTVRAEKERDALASALDQFRSFPDNPGPGHWSTSYRMGYADAGRDVRAIAAALGETGGAE